MQKLPYELDDLTMPEITEILACLDEKDSDADPAQTETALKKIFGKPNG